MTQVAIIRRCAFVMLFALSLPASAADQRAGTLIITQPWSRATPPGAPTGVAYLEIVNKGPADTLVRVESAVSGEVQMHMSYSEAGMTRMRPVASLEIPEGGRVKFKPGGLHLMLVGLEQPLKEGDRVALTLVFQRTGPVRVEAIVQGLGASSPPS